MGWGQQSHTNEHRRRCTCLSAIAARNAASHGNETTGGRRLHDGRSNAPIRSIDRSRAVARHCDACFAKSVDLEMFEAAAIAELHLKSRPALDLRGWDLGAKSSGLPNAARRPSVSCAHPLTASIRILLTQLCGCVPQCQISTNPSNFVMNNAYNSSVFAACLEACQACAIACERCAAACLQEDDVQKMVNCVRLDRDCAAICTLAAAFMARGSDFSRQACELCATICDACALECGTHQMDHCQACAAACRSCSQACRSMGQTQ